MSTPNPSGCLQRWALTLQEYDFEINYKPGKSNTSAHALSRHPFGMVASVSDIGSPSLRFQQIQDTHFGPIIELLENPKAERSEKESENLEHYTLHNGILFHLPSQQSRLSYQFPDQIALPETLRIKALRACHDDILGGHLGIQRTLDKVAQRPTGLA